MFDAYVNQDEDKNRRRRWISVIIAGSVLAHLVVIIAVMIAGMWKVDKNPYRELTDITIRTWHQGVVAPPPLGSNKANQHKHQHKQRKHLVTNRQPTQQRASITLTTNGEVTDGVGSPDGKRGGTGTDPNAQVTSLTACQPGELCGTGTPNLPKVTIQKCKDGTLPPCKQKRPRVVPANVISGKRIAGDGRILPPDGVKVQIAKDDRNQVIGAVLMCLDTSGRVAKLRIVRSTGYNAYDAKIMTTVRTWRYQPYRVNGTAVPVCTSITFIYRQH